MLGDLVCPDSKALIFERVKENAFASCSCVILRRSRRNFKFSAKKFVGFPIYFWYSYGQMFGIICVKYNKTVERMKAMDGKKAVLQRLKAEIMALEKFPMPKSAQQASLGLGPMEASFRSEEHTSGLQSRL